jgi:hypothetical protein
MGEKQTTAYLIRLTVLYILAPPFQSLLGTFAKKLLVP